MAMNRKERRANNRAELKQDKKEFRELINNLIGKWGEKEALDKAVDLILMLASIKPCKEMDEPMRAILYPHPAIGPSMRARIMYYLAPPEQETTTY